VPKPYEAMRDKFIAEGMSEDAAQTKAAKIYNAKRNSGTKGFSEKMNSKADKPQAKFEAKRTKQGAKPW
jgi:hypothetical protein